MSRMLSTVNVSSKYLSAYVEASPSVDATNDIKKYTTIQKPLEWKISESEYLIDLYNNFSFNNKITSVTKIFIVCYDSYCTPK